jgi:hypothetical protein
MKRLVSGELREKYGGIPEGMEFFHSNGGPAVSFPVKETRSMENFGLR